MIKKSALEDIELTQEDMLKISYLQLKSVKEEKGRIKERIRLLEGSLHSGCDEAYGALAELLRDNFDSLSHHDRMDVLSILEKSKKVGCIEPFIDILERFESMEPKSRYLYEQVGKIIELLGKSKRRWLIYILTKYKKNSSRLIRDATNNAMNGGIIMKKKFNQVYQFKIMLRGTKPPIWRRIHVPETYTFWDLHVAIQDVMGWSDYHLHLFEVVDPSTGMKCEIGIPEKEYDEYGGTLSGWKQKIADYFSMENPKADYVYDFGDNWEHNIQLEKILHREKGVNYPVCIKGKRACPPEDCGGVWGYEDFLEAIKDPTHEEHEGMVEWIGGEFDPEQFEVNKVSFDDPDKRRKIAFG